MKSSEKRTSWILVAVIAVAASALVAGAYVATEHFLQDRTSAMNFRGLRPRPTGPQRTVKKYSAKELEEAKKKGQLPRTAQPYSPPAAAQANDAAVQQSLRTLQEIQRINEMNQRLLDQQQRMQNRRQ